MAPGRFTPETLPAGCARPPPARSMPSSPPSTGDPVARLALTAVASGGAGLEVAVEATTGCATVFVYLTTYDQSTSAALTRTSATSLSLVLCLLYLLLF